MGLLSFLGWTREVEAPASKPPPDDDWWYSDPRSLGSVQHDPDTAQRIAAVFCAVQILSRSLAQIPLFYYKRTGGCGKKIAASDPLYTVLHTQPNRQLSHFSFIEMVFGHVLLRGNAYCQILSNRRGEIKELIPLNPCRMRVELNDAGRRVYLYQQKTGEVRTFQQYQILHLTGYCFDGRYGYSPIQVAPEPVDHTISLEEHGRQLFDNKAAPGGILTHPAKLSKEAADRLRQRWDSMVGGARRGSTGVLEEGMTWQQVGMSSVDAQYLEQRRFQIEDIARMYQVPPHMIGDLSRATYSNIEHQSINFVTFSLLPWCKKFEEEMTVALLTEEERSKYLIEFQVNGLMRGDIKSRYDAYAIGRNNGWLSANDIRSLENMNPLPGEQGDIYLVPLNMVDAETVRGKSAEDAEPKEPAAAPEPASDQKPANTDDDSEPTTPKREAVFPHAVAHLEELTTRILRRDFGERAKLEAKGVSAPDFTSSGTRDFAEKLLEAPVNLLISALGVSSSVSREETRRALALFFDTYTILANPERDVALQARRIAEVYLDLLFDKGRMKDAA